MNDVDKLFASLSSEKRALLEKRLLKRHLPVRLGSPSAHTEKAPRPLSFGQESLWFFDQLECNSPLYNLPLAWQLGGPLQVEALRKALETIVQRHESLRTNFISIDHKPMQVVAENKSFALPITDLSALPEFEREQQAKKLMDEEARRPFNLTDDIMLRASLLRLGEDENILCLSVHHIAADAWSLDLLVDELSVLYRSFSFGEKSPLPEFDFQYSDFALCQRERFQGEVGAKRMAYWKDRFSEELPLLELPTDRPRPTTQTFRGALRFFTFPSSLLSALKELSRRENVTVNSTLLTAFQILLHRYSRQDDILVGTPVGTRNRSDTEKLIGYFINTVVLRSNLSGNPVFKDLLQQIHRNMMGALTHQEVSLEQLAEQLKVPRHPGRNPITEVLFQHLATPMKLPDFKDVTAENLPMDTQTSKMDLSFTLRDSPDGLHCEVEYKTELFDPATIDRMAGHYQTLLEAIVGKPAQNIATLPLLTPAEERQILVDWNATEVPFPTDVSIPVLLEKQAEAMPDAVAVICENQQLTYRELNVRANRLARYLEKSGAQPDTLIGICMERSIEMLVAVHGVLKSGAAYLPMDPDYPNDRLQFMLQDAQAPVLLTQKHLAKIIPVAQTNVLCLDSEWETIALESDENLPEKPDSDHLAFVIYTSGSTGRPKGVMISHASICNHLFWMQQQFPLAVADRILQKTSFSFDVSVWELLAPIVSGASLVMAKLEGHRDSAYLAELIIEKEISIIQTVPSALRALVDEPAFANCKSLKYVICGGEEMPVALLEMFRSVLKAQLSNSYGPTEACIDATFWLESGEKKPSSPPIGKPMGNAEAYILDSQLQPVPIGVPGELCVGGRGLARGYLRRPELTEEKFIPNPFASGSRLYKTGDLARYLPDGNIEFLGRIDHQVKVRGFRIELGEIESALRAHPGVRESVVLARKDFSGENQLAAYLVFSQEAATSEAELRNYLKSKLPEFMVPSAFVTLDALPLNPNGKLDRNALPAPEYRRSIAEFVAPRTAVEQELARVWCEVLGIKEIGIHDNFFEFGGHSLLASQIVSRMKRSGQKIVLRDVFQSPTIAGLGSVLEKSRVETSGPAIAPIKPQARKQLNSATAFKGALQTVIVSFHSFLVETHHAVSEIPFACQIIC